MTKEELSLKLEQLVKDNLGKPVEREDPSNLDQCFDWLFAYCDALGIPRSAIRHLRAFQIWTEATDETRKYFDLIPNTATFVPQKGDIVIFGTAVGVSGHVCVASGNNSGLDVFQSTDQNWSGHLFIEYIWHTYGPQTGDKRGVLGVLRPKVTPPVTTEPMVTLPQREVDALRKARDDNFNAAQAANKRIIELNNQIATFALKNEVLINIQKEINRLS